MFSLGRERGGETLVPARQGTPQFPLRPYRSQERAAEALGIVPRHYQKIEAGELNVTLRTLDRLCRAFSVDVDQLFEK